MICTQVQMIYIQTCWFICAIKHAHCQRAIKHAHTNHEVVRYLPNGQHRLESTP